MKGWGTKRGLECTRSPAGYTAPVVRGKKKKTEAEKAFEIIELVAFMFLIQILG